MRTFIFALFTCLAFYSCQPEQQARTERWSKEQANEWYQQWGWLRGSNFQPSTAINQLEMWQAETFDPTTIDRELGWAADIGMNCMRVYLHHVAWEVDKEGFKKRMGQYMDIAAKHGISTIFVFFDDCWNPTYSAGKQPEPKPGIHNSGWVRDPGDLLHEKPELIDLLEIYMKDILTTFRNDKRIVFWDLYNEPGNEGYGDKSMNLLKKSFEWAWTVNPSQPLSAGVWSTGLPDFNKFQLENSDIISYHNYNNIDHHRQAVDTLKRYGRPMICTEYMARHFNSTFQEIMPMLKAENIGAINWGFAAGKTNTIFKWGEPLPDMEEPPLWFHDIFRKDGTPYSQEEIDAIKSLTTDPAPDTLADWSKVSKRLNASFGTIDTRYAKSSVPVTKKLTAWSGSGWRGERISAQVVLWSAANIEQVKCEFTPFVSKANRLDAGIAQARFVQYVLTDIFEPGCGHRKPADFPVSLSPDMLDTLSSIRFEANTTQPVWLTFDIPSDAQPGVYTGTLNIYAREQKTQKLNISFEVLPQTLPAAKDWEFHLDLWQHPSAVARVNNVKHWSEEHWKLLESQMKMLADAGQKVITTTVNKDPWNKQCYDAYEDMILWTKNANGSWTYNYSVFDRWVTFMMKLGITKMINCYSMIPWNNELRYYDAASNAYINVSAKPGTKEFIALWTPFLTDFRKHLEEKGWLQITNIAMDERSPEDMKAMLELLQKVAPEFGVSLADNHKSYKQYPYLKDICIEFGATFEESDLAYRKQHGLTSTFYVCCADKFPNVFTFSDPAEAAYAGWYVAAAGLDGFLRWAYNSWVENPTVDSRFRTWPAGDTYITYPGARSSIRFERLREGIQDAEKIRILRQFLLASPDKLEKLNAEIEKFNIHSIPATPCSEMLQKGKKVLEELSR